MKAFTKWLLAMAVALVCVAAAFAINRFFLSGHWFYDAASVAIFVAVILYILTGIKERPEG
ncbi:hypothetical protein [Lysobacter niastensis]|uniref:Phosphatase PAP2 family protein n=1 Tax=Lysobacter niastensis TaxID=380629 RepID=A0ABS0BBI3_9GAMM|nr:hypothetical protein [Lysobacter niastensis]MBF6025267.1 hypothetical protein [Lysobacter niastensis]